MLRVWRVWRLANGRLERPNNRGYVQANGRLQCWNSKGWPPQGLVEADALTTEGYAGKRPAKHFRGFKGLKTGKRHAWTPQQQRLCAGKRQAATLEQQRPTATGLGGSCREGVRLLTLANGRLERPNNRGYIYANGRLQSWNRRGLRPQGLVDNVEAMAVTKQGPHLRWSQAPPLPWRRPGSADIYIL